MSLSFNVPGRRIRAVSLRPIPRRPEQEPEQEEPPISHEAEERAAPAETEAAEQASPQIDLEAEIEEKAAAIAEAKIAERLQPLRQMLESMMKEFEAWRRETTERLENAAVRLAFEIAKKILHEELKMRPELVRNTVKKALKQIADAGTLQIHCHPDDLELLKQDAEIETLMKKQAAAMEWIADASVGRGGCLIKSDKGTVDATIESQLQEIHQHLFPAD